MRVIETILRALELGKSVRRAVFHHGVGVRESHHALLDEVAEHFEVGLLVLEVSRSDAVHVTIRSLDDVLVDGCLLLVGIENDLRVPATYTQRVDDRQGILAESVGPLIGPPGHLEDDNMVPEPLGGNGFCRLHGRSYYGDDSRWLRLGFLLLGHRRKLRLRWGWRGCRCGWSDHRRRWRGSGCGTRRWYTHRRRYRRQRCRLLFGSPTSHSDAPEL
mmetsp:Transcript_38389/g.64490  ORF Transcript_38389/g.64490 Transcript_38389/m.64490 type:complete len:217 (-) Transcript_38389:97-747(-)